MAQSPAHKLGQIIGDALEAAIHEPLQEIAAEFGLYLDYEHARAIRGGKKKVAWTDRYGNTHDLDYVLEEDGSEDKAGRPRAFIETAWRRYTKHSRNKAQEIQGAISPLAETYQASRPFLGVVLGGVFTEGALDQFRSHDFKIAYCPYETVLAAFAAEGIDVSSEEHSSDTELQQKVEAYAELTPTQHERIGANLRALHEEQFTGFFRSLRYCLGRSVQEISIVALSGASYKFGCIDDAVQFIVDHDQATPAANFVRYELTVRYSNGDEIQATFGARKRAVEFLRLFDR